jgi:hypothetical protein
VAVSCLLAAACSGGTPAAPKGPPGVAAAPAVRDRLAADSRSLAEHDTEIDALTAHDGRPFAATDQWEYPGSPAYGQVLVKDSDNGPWRVFEQTQSLRVQVIDSFPIPADQGLGPGHELLITQAVVGGRSELQWLLDGASAFSPADSFPLASASADVRSFASGKGSIGYVIAAYNDFTRSRPAAPHGRPSASSGATRARARPRAHAARSPWACTPTTRRRASPSAPTPARHPRTCCAA